jgi:HD-like signal output (HDOD) protein
VPAALRDILTRIQSLEPLPQVALRVLELSGRRDVVPAEREIASLPEAGNRLGVTTLASLVLTSCAARHFRDYGAADAAEAESFWRRCVGDALATALLARLHMGFDEDRASARTRPRC